MKNLSELRDEIDSLDREAVRLLNRRAECVLALAPLKRQQGRPVHEPMREQLVLGNILASNGGPLKNDSLERIFEAVIKEMRDMQRERDS